MAKKESATESVEETPTEKLGKYKVPSLGGKRLIVYARNASEAREKAVETIKETNKVLYDTLRGKKPYNDNASTLEFEHKVTEEDLIATPELADKGVKAGDVIKIDSEKLKSYKTN